MARSNTVQLVLGAIVGIVALLLILMVGPGMKVWMTNTEFDRATWIKKPPAEDGERTARDRMADSVVEWLNQENPTRESVLEKLGEPDRRYDATRWRGDFRYILGSGRSGGMDPYTLEIWFDDGRVSRARVKQL